MEIISGIELGNPHGEKRKRLDQFQKMFEYKIVAFPDKQISGKIKSLQKGVTPKNKEDDSINGAPQISVLKFFAYEIIEEVLIKWVQRICSLHEEFPVTLNNIGASPNGNRGGTIFLRVMNPDPFQQISSKMNAVEDLIKSSGGRLMMRGKNPCIIISENLPDSEFINVMLDLSRKTFYETFTIHELWLMKKSNTGAGDQLVNIFRLQPTGLTSA